MKFGDIPLVINHLQTPEDNNASGPMACLSLHRDLQHALDDVLQEEMYFEVWGHTISH